MSDHELTEDLKFSLNQITTYVFSPLVNHTQGCAGRGALEQQGQSWALVFVPTKTPLKVVSDKCNNFKLFVLSSDFASRAVNRNSEI